MARSTLGFASLPALSMALACATAVEQGFVDDDTPGPGGSQSNLGGSASGGKASGGGGKVNGSAGKATNAFGGSGPSTAGTSGTPNDGDAGNGGMPSAGDSSGGKAGGGGGGASAGAGGTNAGSGGAAGSAGSTSSTGECAPAGSGWVVQYWTNTPAANMPAGEIRIFNNNGGATNFTALELRHYFTNEETANLTFTFSTFGHNFPVDPYHQDEGGGNVQSSIVAVAPAVTNASHYIRIKFNATPGNFGPNEYANLGFYGSLSMYPLKSNQANDYTYIGHATADPGSANKTSGWDHITLYKDGTLVWGCEP